MQKQTTIFETFNAKYLTFQEVSMSFIPNEEYFQLLENNHSLIMGPRGCGKTTLLKMLTSAGINYWKSDSAEEVKKKIPFTAVYIPSDIQWKSQVTFIEKHFNTNPQVGEVITDFLITTNIQIALIRSIEGYLKFEYKGELNVLLVEDIVSRKLINVWGIEKPISPSFDEIELALQARVTFINSLVNIQSFRKDIESLLKELPQYVYLNFFDVVKLACLAFETSIGLDKNHRWALCFDELEISPKFLQIKLLKFLRSVDQKFLFKLTTTPLVNIDNIIIESSQNNDFRAVKLWVYDDSGAAKWQEFCKSLLTTKIQKRYFNTNIQSRNVFGEYNLDDIIKEELEFKGDFQKGTGQGSSVNMLFKALSHKDTGFRKFLNLKGINPEDPYSGNKAQDKSIFLKQKVNVLYRIMYRNRTRRTTSVHYGVPYLYEICDGNPRSLIGLADDILNKLDSLPKSNGIISRTKQSELIVEVSKKYFSLIKNHPDSTVNIRGREFNLATDLLAPIGNYIFTQIVKTDYNPSVPTTFIVDAEIDVKILRLLEHALFIGAIIYLDPIESISNTGLIGKRFRLSYLLTPAFRIPNRTNSHINLQTILSDKWKLTDQMFLDL